MNDPLPNHHATAILVGETGILIRGRARSGKSALALAALLRAEMLGLAAWLVADDQVLLAAEDGELVARPPAAIAGRMEISGVGIVSQPWTGRAVIRLVAELREPQDIERLPESNVAELLGIALPRIVLPAREAGLGADILHTVAMRRQAARDRETALTKS